jgi:hypothetical protein
MVSVPVREPEADGLKVTVTLQIEPDSRVLPQVLLSVKSPELEFPPIVMLAIVSGPVPLLLMVTVWIAAVTPTFVLGKVSLVVESPAEGIAIPVPVRATFWVLPGTLFALSVIVSDAPREPAAVGLNVREIEQDRSGQEWFCKSWQELQHHLHLHP